MMTEKLTTIARPYAFAAFENALDRADLLPWETMLATAALIAEDKTMMQLFNNPQVTHKELVELFCDILEPQLDKEKKNFICLLAEYDRLSMLPEIARLFAEYRADYEKTMTVQVTSAIPLDEKYKQKFVTALTKRLQRKVTLQCEVDPSLIGGATVHASDMVIDGSIRGKLNRMIEFI